MKKSTLCISTAIIGAFALVQANSATASITGSGTQQTKGKCYGAALKGQNECAQSGGHGCKGQSKRNNDPRDYIFVVSKAECDQNNGRYKPIEEKGTE